MDKLKKIYKDRLSFNSIDSEDCVLDAMRLAYNQAIQDAVNNAAKKFNISKDDTIIFFLFKPT